MSDKAIFSTENANLLETIFSLQAKSTLIELQRRGVETAEQYTKLLEAEGETNAFNDSLAEEELNALTEMGVNI